MGLDMYLNARRYVSPYSDTELHTQLMEVTKDICSIMSCRGVEFEAIYWRKANAIHQWFVTNVQNGIDDCGQYPVSVEQLTELKTTIETILADKEQAATLLPPQSGFFFGSTDIGPYYFEDLQYTRSEEHTSELQSH